MRKCAARVAQLVERLTCNEDVAGSTPVSGSIYENIIQVGFPSGQREQTVNLSAKPSEVRILPPPPILTESYVGDFGSSRGRFALHGFLHGYDFSYLRRTDLVSIF